MHTNPHEKKVGSVKDSEATLRWPSCGFVCIRGYLLPRDLFWSQRGVSHAGIEGILVLYGNDGYTGSVRSRLEVALLRERLEGAGIPEFGFGLDPEDGYTWAMIVDVAREPDGHRFAWDLQQWVHEAWQAAWGITLDDPKPSHDRAQRPSEPSGSQVASDTKDSQVA